MFNTKNGSSISNRARLHIKPNFNSSLNLYSQNKNFADIEFSANRFDYEDLGELARSIGFIYGFIRRSLLKNLSSRGRFSICKRCHFKPDDVECAGKFIAKNLQSVETAYTEYSTMAKLKHENIISVFKFIDFNEQFSLIIMEL
jgi:hypothetical protein